jgi:tetratricopeptide (TPR) repeat protein
MDDPMLLEDLMLSALGRMRDHRQGPQHLGKQEQEREPELPFIVETTLDLLLHRHGDPRLGWDRTAPALQLLQERRYREVMEIFQSLPAPKRPERLWESGIQALLELGDLDEAASASKEALERYPASFPLWMESFRISMDYHNYDEGLRVLEHAQGLLPSDPMTTNSPQQWVWSLRRAEYAHWVEGKSELAWELLNSVPEAYRGDHHPPLKLQIQVSLGYFEEAYHSVVELLTITPKDLELQMLQAECMAGMETWEALPAFLDQFDSAAQNNRPDYWHLRGLSLAHLGDLHLSREYLERATQMSPRTLRYVLDAGHAGMELGDFPRAEQHWRQALHLDATSEEALIQLAETRQALYDAAGAKRLLRECLIHHPESEEAQTFLARLEAN